MDTQKNDSECKMTNFGDCPWVLLFIKPCREVTATPQQPAMSLKVMLDFMDKDLDERLVIQFDNYEFLKNFFKILGHLKNDIC